MIEESLDEQFAEKKIGGAALREACGAAVWAALIAKGVPARGDHLAEMIADREVFMKGQNNAGVRQDVADMFEHLHTEDVEMVEMNDVGAQFSEQRTEFTREVRVGICEFEPVEAVGRVQIFPFAEGLGQHTAEPPAPVGTLTSQKPGFGARAVTQTVEHLEGRNLRAAFRESWMAVRGDENPQVRRRFGRCKGALGVGSVGIQD
ncbi:MAG: hypothetical protein PHT60_14480 [Acidiphilium sp.]|nr:hypothetical protein [Acidiphilium sp.]MDD4936968.1 hypothetical protein [Acidiphilium sp.]